MNGLNLRVTGIFVKRQMKKIAVTLTDAELDYCNAEGISPTEFAKTKAERTGNNVAATNGQNRPGTDALNPELIHVAKARKYEQDKGFDRLKKWSRLKFQLPEDEAERFSARAAELARAAGVSVKMAESIIFEDVAKILLILPGREGRKHAQ